MRLQATRFLVLIFIWLAAEWSPAQSDSDSKEPIRVVSWNLENFFDRYDDPWRADERTKPAYVNSSREKRLAQLLRELDADILCLQEIENRFVLQKFVDQFLPDAGYEVVLFEGNDGRGIDVAVLSKLPVGAVTSYRHLQFQDAEGRTHRFQRDLLRVRIGGALQADVFVVHLKSQHGGDAADALRLAEAKQIAAVFQQEFKHQPEFRALLAGDFNDTPESPTLKAILQTGLVDACASTDKVSYNQKPYRSRIDFLLMSPALAKDLKKAEIQEDETVLKASDHNPVWAEFRPRNNP
ncbi:MAG: hypothetical protein DWQ01_04025 [Planctomycetota bacterium]|nr:MAG: hypothetical protein DWQ01_04025 [Planctomycetota bacterium]